MVLAQNAGESETMESGSFTVGIPEAISKPQTRGLLLLHLRFNWCSGALCKQICANIKFTIHVFLANHPT